jgi:hypothetical protein
MEWREATNDQIDEALDHFAGLSSAAMARVCDLIAEVDARQSWMGDGAGSLTDWVAAKLRIRHKTATRLVAISRQLTGLPHVRACFSAGDLSLDQVDAVARMASPETEEAIVDEAMTLSSAALDLKARRRRSVSEEEAMSVWERRKLIRQWNLDESELRFHGRLPGAEGRVFDQAIDSRVDEMSPNPETGMFDPLQVRAADALTELAATDGETGSPTQITVFTDITALTSKEQGHAELDNTAALSNPTLQRLACDAILESVLKDGTRGHRRRQTQPHYPRVAAASRPPPRRPTMPTPGLSQHQMAPDPSHRPLGSRRPHRPRQPHPLMRHPPPLRPRTRLAHNRTTPATSLPPTRLDPLPPPTPTTPPPPTGTGQYLGAAAPASDRPVQYRNDSPIAPKPVGRKALSIWPMALTLPRRAF